MFLTSSMALSRRCYRSSRHLCLALVVSWSRSNLTRTQYLSSLATEASSACHHHLQQRPPKPPLSSQKSGGDVPLLLLSSPARPETRFLYEITPDCRIQSRAQIELPDYAANPQLVSFGSSQGYFFSVPYRSKSPGSILAIDPITRQSLSLPPLSLLRRHPNASYDALSENKAVVSPSHDTFVLLRHEEQFFARVGGQAWASLDVPVGHLTDCFFHKGLLHAANHLGSFFVYDLDGPSPSRPISSCLTSVSYPLEQYRDFRLPLQRYFVASPDGSDFFFVLRGGMATETENCARGDVDYTMLHDITGPDWGPGHPLFRTKNFRVFKFFEASGRWKLIDRLGGLALLVGPGQTLSLFARDFPSLEPDCIYFTDHCKYDHMLQPERIGDTGVFRLEDRSVQLFKLADEDLLLNRSPPLWFVPTDWPA